MTAPATPVRPAPTHPCARCGASVAIDVGLCERCNPIGLKDSASSQVHGTVFVAVGLAIVTLAIVAHLAVQGIGPFTAAVTAVRPGSVAGSVIATLEVRNDGPNTGSATCRITDPADRAYLTSAVITSPRIDPGRTIRIDQEVGFGDPSRLLAVACDGP
jgi:hypothetical protein